MTSFFWMIIMFILVIIVNPQWNSWEAVPFYIAALVIGFMPEKETP